jgi:ATP-dependent Zn protease
LGEEKAKPAPEIPGDVKFDDIVGIDEYKDELKDIIDYFKNEKLY